MFLARVFCVGLGVLSAAAGSVSAQTKDDVTNQLLLDALTGGASPLTQRRLLSAISDEYPDSPAAQSLASGAVNLPGLPDDPAWTDLLVEDSVVTGFSHGTYPSVGNATHPGFDIGLPGTADCGVPVYAPRAGLIRRIVASDVPAAELTATGITGAENTRDLEHNTGNAVMLRHDDQVPPVYSIYLHLRDSPAKADGTNWRVGQTIAAGEQIGLVGNTGFSGGCHLHFEARRFEGTRRYIHADYGNIYPSGDVTKSATFLEDWIDPSVFLRQSFIAEHLRAKDGSDQVAAALPDPELPGTHANSSAQTASVGGIAVAEAAEPEPAEPQAHPGDWIEADTPRRKLTPGATMGDLAMAADGSATYRGETLFPSVEAADAFELHVYFSPRARQAIVLQWDTDLAGVRAALINLAERKIVRTDLIPESAVHRKVAAEDVRLAMTPVAWSDDGRYAAFPLSPGEWQADPLFIDTETGAAATAEVDEFGQGQWGYPKFETLRSDSADWVEMDYDVLACADADCTAPEVVGTVSGDHRITALLANAPVRSDETAPAPTAPDTWGPGLVAEGDIGYFPCRDAARETPDCLRDLGLSEEAIAFSFARDGDYSGSTVGSDFIELGAVDVAESQFIGNTVYYTPMLVNGPAGFTPLEFTRGMAQVFRDDASRKMLSQFPRAENIGGLSIRSHRRLADGTQRFVLSEIVVDGCRACAILGSAISFIDVGPATNNQLVRRPVGVLLESPGDDQDLTPELIRTRPQTLQVMLNTLGYDAGSMDGFPGPQTRQALMEFQVAHCLPPTGQPDRATAQAMFDATGFETPCAEAELPAGVAANTPLLPGRYVDDLAFCAAEIPYETIHLRQRIIRPDSMTWGVEGLCQTNRTDIRNGVTLFRGPCYEADHVNDASWRFDVLSNDSFIDLDMPTAIPRDATPRRYFRCPGEDASQQVAANAAADRSQASDEDAVIHFFEPAAGSDLRRDILNALRPTAETVYGARVEFIVSSIKVAGADAFVSALAQRPNGAAIDIQSTPGFRAGQLFEEPGTPNEIQAILQRTDAGWGVVKSVLQPTEPWWYDDCEEFWRLFPEICEAMPINTSAVEADLSAHANSTVSSLPANASSDPTSSPDMPNFREIIDGLDYVGAADKAATTELVQTAFTLLAKMEPDGYAKLLGISASDFAAEFVLDPEAMLTVIGADIVVSAGEAIFAEAAGDLVAAYMFADGPLSELPDEWQVPLRAFVDATIVESVGLLATGTNPTPAALVGPIIGRLQDVWEIYKATNALSRAQASGLFAVANGAEITAEMVRKYPSEKTETLMNSWFGLTRTNLRDIVGADDVNAAYTITVLGYRALDAQARGDLDTARAEIEKMRATGKAEQGLTPLSAEGPIDLLVRLASGGNDAPNVLVETFLKATALRTLHPDVEAERAKALVATGVAAGWRGQPGVVDALAEIVVNYPAKSIGGCSRAHGPLPPEMRRRLFKNAAMTVSDQRSNQRQVPVTKQMIEGDRFCLSDNNARCAASNYQLHYCSSDEMVFVNPSSGFSGTIPVTNVTERPRNLLMTGRVNSRIYGRNQPDIYSQGTRCALSNGWDQANAFRWNGQCANGRATGSGIIEWLRGPEVIWRTRVGPEWGLSLNEGVISYDLDLDAFDVALTSCDQRLSGFRGVELVAPQGTPRAFFENSWVVSELMRRGALFAQAECPVENKRLSNIVVELKIGDEQIVRGRNYDTDQFTWREFSNPVERTMMNDLQNAERQRQANERQRAAQARAEALAAELRRRQEAIVAAAEQFIETGRGSLDDLAAALEVDHIGTLGRLERGATLRLGPVEGLATVTHDGKRHYQVNYATSSPFQRLEREFRSRQDFSWENWMAMTQSGSPARTDVSCLFEQIGRIPQETRDVRLELVSFSRGSSSTRISFVCK